MWVITVCLEKWLAGRIFICWVNWPNDCWVLFISVWCYLSVISVGLKKCILKLKHTSENFVLTSIYTILMLIQCCLWLHLTVFSKNIEEHFRDVLLCSKGCIASSTSIVYCWSTRSKYGMLFTKLQYMGSIFILLSCVTFCMLLFAVDWGL